MLEKWVADSVANWFQKDAHATFYERIQCLMDSEPLYRDLPFAVRYGKTLAYTLERISVPIHPDERIVGSVKEIVPDREQRAAAERFMGAWWKDGPESIQQGIRFFYSYGWLKNRAPWFHSFGHLALDWERLVGEGLGSFEALARRTLARPEMERDPDRRSFLEGAILCIEALSAYVRRWAAEEARQAAHCAEPARAAKLRRMAASLEHLTTGPARSFHEALQLVWLVAMPLQKVCGCGVFNYSRMDQYLLPFYRRDLAAGTLTRDEALSLLHEFYDKNNEIFSPTDHMSQEVEATSSTLEVAYDDPNYVILGGLLPGREPGVNELTELFVQAAHDLRLRNPFIVFRWYRGLDPAVWRRVVAAMRDNATIIVYDDETMIPAFQAYGVEERDAFGYGLYGCNDPNIPAKEGGLRQLWFNLARPFELAMNRGDSPMAPLGGEGVKRQTQHSLEDRMIGIQTGPYYGPRTRPLEEMRSIDDLLEAYREQVRFLLRDYRAGLERDLEVERRASAGRIRIEDCFLQGTLETATTWNDGGTRYHKITVQGSGLATAIDCFAAVEQLVFRDRVVTLPELQDILKENWAGHEDMRARLVRKTPKFGNDVEWVDALARKVADVFCDEVAACNEPRYLYAFFPCISTDRDFTTMGKWVGATPDGRRAGQQVSENTSPTEGADGAGLTALLNSVARLPMHRFTGGPLNVRLHPSAVAGPRGVELLAAALQTYFEAGAMNVMINVVSREQLLDAQVHPDKYRSLCVRVTGYSAYFTQMGRQAQDELIRRTEKTS
jgi:trans-4-hydroxy-L-proline dehydratase